MSTMEDRNSTIPVVEGEENVLAAAQNFVRALETNRNLTEDMKKILEDLNIQLSTMNIKSENRRGICEIEEQLNSVEEKVMRWESDQSMIWDSIQAASEYLQAVDEVRQLTVSIERLSLNEDRNVGELLRQTHRVLQVAMARLEEEFSYILVQNRQPFEPEHVSFRRSWEDDLVDEVSTISIEYEPVEESQRRDSSSRVSEEFFIDLINPDVIPDLKRIANVMITSKYDQECCQAYISTRKDALDECLSILEVETMSIEEVLRMDWSSLNLMIKKWVRAMKIFIRVYLTSEKQLCDQIFGEFGSIDPVCFVETSKSSVLRLLSFGEAVAVGPLKPEKLFRILDMYEVLKDLLPDIDNLFPDEVGYFVKTESHEVLKRLGDSVIGTLSEFENAVGSNISTTPFAGGGIHHLTKYVMNYMTLIIDYSDTLNLLLQVPNGEESVSLSPNMSQAEEENEGESSSRCTTPMAHHFRSITTILESNLISKSNLYRDGSLQHFFLMNNIYYMVNKVKGSELGSFYGDNWIRQHNRKFQQHAMNYERATWNSILALLKEEGIYNPGSHSASKTILKDRFRSFNVAFDEVYKNQTGWLIPDPQLREDLRISVSLKVIQAYRTFLGRHASHLDGRHSEKYIKHSADDLQNYLLDFFEGSPRSLNYKR